MPFCSVWAPKGLGAAQVTGEGHPAFLSPPVQVLISPTTALVDRPRNNVSPAIWASHGPIKLTHKIDHRTHNGVPSSISVASELHFQPSGGLLNCLQSSALTSNVAMSNSFAYVILQKCEEVYLLAKFLEEELPGQSLCAFVILMCISQLHTHYHQVMPMNASARNVERMFACGFVKKVCK